MNQSTPIAQSNIVGSSDGKKTKKPKTRKFLNRGRSLDQCETSESETESDISRSVPNKPPRRKNRNRNTSSGSDLDSSQAPQTKALKGILKKQNSVEKPPSSESIAAKRLTMRRGSSVDSALPPSTQFSGKVFKGLNRLEYSSVTLHNKNYLFTLEKLRYQMVFDFVTDKILKIFIILDLDHW